MLYLEKKYIYHVSSDNNLKLKNGYLSFFSSTEEYAFAVNNFTEDNILKIFERYWCKKMGKKNIKCCCDIDENTQIYTYVNNRILKLIELQSEYTLYAIQLMLGNKNLIYYLIKNSIDGFYMKYSISNASIYAILIDNNMEFIQKKNIIRMKSINKYYSYNRLLYTLVTFICELIPALSIITFNIAHNKNKDKKKYILEHNKFYPNIEHNVLTICTYNIHFFRDVNYKYTYRKIMNFFSKKIDILCLQEVYHTNNILINLLLPSKEKFINDLNNIGFKYYVWDEEVGIITLSKFKIIESKKIIYKNKGAIYTKININGEHINIYNVHLDVKNEETRYEQIEKIIDHSLNRKKVIILGDFNSLYKNEYSYDGWNEIKRTQRYYMPEKNIVINKMLKYYNNVNNYKDKMTSFYRRKVDYVFTSDDIYSENKEILILENNHISDHHPIIFNIK